MSFELTEEQIMIRTMVRDFAREVLLPTAMERDRTKEFPLENLKKMGELGLLGMMVPPKYNGAGVDTVSYVLALQEVAYACASTAVVMSVQNSIVCETINRFGTEAQKEAYLKPLAAGHVIGAFALTEPHAGSDPVSQSTSAVLDGHRYILNGSKRFITSGKHAGVTIITAKTDKTKRHKGISAFIIEKGTSGFSVGKTEEKMGLCASDTTDLHFEDCRIPEANVLGEVDRGVYILMRGLDTERLVLSAGPIGIMQACMDIALPYVRERRQFDQPIGNFGIMQAKLADMYTALQSARAFTYRVADQFDRGQPTRQDAAACLLLASQSAVQVALEAIQSLGGNGYINEYATGRLLRDAKLYEIGAGTSEIRRMLIGRQLVQAGEAAGA